MRRRDANTKECITAHLMCVTMKVINVVIVAVMLSRKSQINL
jgi:hypothetical protein